MIHPPEPSDSDRRPALVDPVATKIAGLEVPDEFYPVLASPAALAGMVLPRLPGPDWESLHLAGFRWVLCLCADVPRYDPAPLAHLAKVELTDLIDGGEPEDPEMEERGIHILGNWVYERLCVGEGVVVHCAGGRGRTGTVIGVVLRKFGFSPEEIVDHLVTIHRARGKPGWPESAWQRGVVERAT